MEAESNENQLAVTSGYLPEQRQMWHLHDARRTALLSVLYYSRKLETPARLGIGLNIAGVVLGSAAFLQPLFAWLPSSTVWIGLIAAVASAAASLLGLSERICKLTSMRDGWHRHLVECEQLIESISKRGHLIESDSILIELLHRNAGALCVADEPNPDRELVRKLTAAIEESHPAARLWMPSA